MQFGHNYITLWYLVEHSTDTTPSKLFQKFLTNLELKTTLSLICGFTFSFCYTSEHIYKKITINYITHTDNYASKN